MNYGAPYPFDPCLEVDAAGLEARLEHYQLAEILQNCGATETQLATALGQNWREILERRKSNGMPLKQSQ